MKAETNYNTDYSKNALFEKRAKLYSRHSRILELSPLYKGAAVVTGLAHSNPKWMITNRPDAIRGPAIKRPDAGNVLWEGTE